MQNHWPRGKHPNFKGKGQNKSQKLLNLSGKKKTDKKGKGKEKEKAQLSANVLSVPELTDLSIQTVESIDFLCYKTSEKVEWCLDSGCTDHITPSKSNFVQYRELGQASKAEIADGKYLKIEGYGTVIGYNIMLNKTVTLQIQNVLYVPEANKQLFCCLPPDNMAVCPKQQTRVQQYPKLANPTLLVCPSQEDSIPLTWDSSKTRARFQGQ